MNQIQVGTKVNSSPNFFIKAKSEVFKAIILLVAVIYLYYCAVYSVYWYLLN